MANKVRNTTAEIKADPLLGLALSMGGDIEAMEARGQRELVESQVLPIKMNPEDKKALETFGVVFGEPVEGDDLFVHATLPKGWKKEAHDSHDMWSYLLDDRNRRRASIFYKAAFYDRKAHLNLTAFYTIETDYEDRSNPEAKVIRSYVKGSGESVVFDTGWVSDEGFGTDSYKLCEKWLNSSKPDWRNSAAYW